MSAVLKSVGDETAMMRDFGALLGRILVGPSAKESEAEAAWREHVCDWPASSPPELEIGQTLDSLAVAQS